jgi:hypothetical protein
VRGKMISAQRPVAWAFSCGTNLRWIRFATVRLPLRRRNAFASCAGPDDQPISPSLAIMKVLAAEFSVVSWCYEIDFIGVEGGGTAPRRRCR